MAHATSVGAQRTSHWRHLAASALVGLGFFTATAAAEAQITMDGSLGPAGALAGPNYVIGSNLGQVRNSNLFHSFGQFNVLSGQSATFTGPGNITNIIGRVTGGQLSTIDGLIDTRTSMPNANFFLLNPSGFMFGSGAVLNVGGSVHFTTADYLRFADNTQFFSRLTPDSALTVSAPSAFGFLGPSTAPITVEGSGLAVFAVDAGKTLSFVGGPTTIRGATLSAPGGRVQVVAAAGAGELPVGNVEAGSVSQFGAVEISSGSFIDVSGDPGGTVMIRGGRVVIDGASLSTGTLGAVDPPTTVGIDIFGQQQVAVSGGSFIQSVAAGGGRGGDVLIASGTTPTTGSVEVSGGSVVLSSTSSTGRGGDVQLTAGRVTVDDATIGTVSQFGEGRGGDLTLRGDVINLSNGASLQSINQNFTLDGRGGDISIQATGSVTIAGQNAFGASSEIRTSTDGAGDGGRVSISAPALTMEPGTQINSIATFADGGPGGTGGAIDIDVGRFSQTQGTINSVSSAFTAPPPGATFVGGNISVNVTGEANITGENGGIFSIGSGAPTGDIQVAAGTLRLTDRAVIQAGSFAGDAEGGNVTVRASDSLVIAGGAGISSQSFNLDVGTIRVSAPNLTIDQGFINSGTFGAGRAGDIAIDVGTLTMTNGAQIASSNVLAATGRGGTITVNASGPVTMSGGAPGGVGVLPEPFRGFVFDTSTGIFSTASSDSPLAGPGGSITVSSPSVSLSAGARLDTGTIGAGQGGSIAVNAGTLSLTGPGSGLFSDTGPFLGAPANSGVGGNIDVVAKNVSVQDGATISANSRGTASALAGNINVAFGDTLQLTNSNITTESLLADGGNITITSTGSTLYLLNGQILTSVQSGLGAGGNITIGTSAHPLSFLVLNNGGIHANAFGGPGGNINIFSDSFFTNVPVATAITASSALSAPGTINISATITDVSGSLAELPSGLFTAAALLRASCASRLAEGKASSLVVEGREGVPLEPDGLLPSGVVEGGVAPRTSTSDPVVSAQLAPLRLAYFDDRCRR